MADLLRHANPRLVRPEQYREIFCDFLDTHVIEQIASVLVATATDQHYGVQVEYVQVINVK